MYFASIFATLAATKIVYGARPTPSIQTVAEALRAEYTIDPDNTPMPLDQVPNDIVFTLVENRFYQYSIRAQRCDTAWRGVFNLDFSNHQNVVIRDDESYSAPEFVNLLNTNDFAVSMGSFRTEGPSEVRMQTMHESYSESFGSIGMRHRSQFARRFRNMMILPLESGALRMISEDGYGNWRVGPASNPGFQMIANIIDPSVYCYENTIAYTGAMEGDALRFRARSAILPAGADLSTVITQEPIRSSHGESYEMKFGTLSVSLDVHDALSREIERVSGLSLMEFQRSPSCQNMLDRLPTLKFTILEADGSSNVVDVYLQPQDYFTLENGPRRFCRIDVIGMEGDRQSISAAFLKQVGVFVDYENRQFGFCDPL